MFTLSHNNISLAALRRHARQALHVLPPMLGADAVREIKGNFRLGGFMDTSLEPWPARKYNPDPGRGILIGKGTGHLWRDIRILGIAENSVTVGTTMPYARIHNEGGTIAHPGGTAFFKKGGKTIWVSNNAAAKLATGGRNLPRTKPHGINIPQRKFMGKSAALNKSLKAIVVREVNKIVRANQNQSNGGNI